MKWNFSKLNSKANYNFHKKQFNENRICKKCNSRFTDTYSFCPRCGLRLIKFKEEERKISVDVKEKKYIITMKGKRKTYSDSQCVAMFGKEYWELYKQNNFVMAEEGKTFEQQFADNIINMSSGKLIDFKAQRKDFIELNSVQREEKIANRAEVLNLFMEVENHNKKVVVSQEKINKKIEREIQSEKRKMEKKWKAQHFKIVKK